MATPVSTRIVSVRLEARPVASRWASHEWGAVAVEESASPTAGAQGPFEIGLYRDESEGYFLNSSSGAPKAFVMWRTPEEGEGTPIVQCVTLSYNEAARLMDAQERVDAVDLPAPLAAWLAEHVATHYTPEPKKRRVKASFLAPRERDRL